MKFILGKKIEMTQIFNEDGSVTPVTRIQAGPCEVVQVKNIDRDGYTAAQVGFGEKKRVSKAIFGHLKGKKFRYLKEFRLPEGQEVKDGQQITAGVFAAGDIVKVTGISKGKGFQGVVKRHGFHGSPATHGHKDQLRMPGSIGATDAARVFKGTRMGGRMGGDQVTVSNLEIIKVDPENNLIYIKGAVPGARNGLILIKGEGELKEITVAESVKEAEEVKEDKPAEAPAEAAEEVKEEKQPAEDVKEEPVKEETKEDKPAEAEKEPAKEEVKTEEVKKEETK